MITYTLTATGYIVFVDGVEWVACPFDPAQSGETPFADDAAKLAHLQASYPDAVAA